VAKKQAVGLFVFTELPEMGLVAVLQRRGEFNHEKMGPESFPGGCQATAHGGVNEGESIQEALYREIREELGESFLIWLLAHPGTILTLGTFENERTVNTNFFTLVPADLLKKIRLEVASGGITLIRERDLQSVEPLEGFDRKVGVTDRRVLALFSDDIAALRSAFVDWDE